MTIEIVNPTFARCTPDTTAAEVFAFIKGARFATKDTDRKGTIYVGNVASIADADERSFAKMHVTDDAKGNGDKRVRYAVPAYVFTKRTPVVIDGRPSSGWPDSFTQSHLEDVPHVNVGTRKSTATPARFRVYDDDGNLYAEGVANLSDDDSGFGPLHDYAMGAWGCTEIRYWEARDGVFAWRTL